MAMLAAVLLLFWRRRGSESVQPSPPGTPEKPPKEVPSRINTPPTKFDRDRDGSQGEGNINSIAGGGRVEGVTPFGPFSPTAPGPDAQEWIQRERSPSENKEDAVLEDVEEDVEAKQGRPSNLLPPVQAKKAEFMRKAPEVKFMPCLRNKADEAHQGSTVCEHNKIKTLCKECGGSSPPQRDFGGSMKVTAKERLAMHLSREGGALDKLRSSQLIKPPASPKIFESATPSEAGFQPRNLAAGEKFGAATSATASMEEASAKPNGWVVGEPEREAVRAKLKPAGSWAGRGLRAFMGGEAAAGASHTARERLTQFLSSHSRLAAAPGALSQARLPGASGAAEDEVEPFAPAAAAEQSCSQASSEAAVQPRAQQASVPQRAASAWQ